MANKRTYSLDPIPTVTDSHELVIDKSGNTEAEKITMAEITAHVLDGRELGTTSSHAIITSDANQFLFHKAIVHPTITLPQINEGVDVVVTSTEINYLDNVTSNIQIQINNKKTDDQSLNLFYSFIPVTSGPYEITSETIQSYLKIDTESNIELNFVMNMVYARGGSSKNYTYEDIMIFTKDVKSIPVLDKITFTSYAGVSSFISGIVSKVDVS